MKSVHTIKNYLSYLEEAYLLFQINAFSFKLKEQIRQPKKIYCIDTGLINAIIPKSTSDYGRIMENLVFVELKRQNKEVYFYAQGNYEVDFLIREGQRIEQLIQVCHSLEQYDTRKRETKSLLKAATDLKCEDLLIITWDKEEEAKINSRQIRFLPLWRWLLLG